MHDTILVSHDTSAFSFQPTEPVKGEEKGLGRLLRGKRVLVRVKSCCCVIFQVLTYRNRIDELQKQ